MRFGNDVSSNNDLLHRTGHDSNGSGRDDLGSDFGSRKGDPERTDNDRAGKSAGRGEGGTVTAGQEKKPPEVRLRVGYGRYVRLGREVLYVDAASGCGER